MVKFRTWLNSQYQKHKRVWRLLKKPSMQEFKTTAKVSAVGLIIIGAMGFIISVAMKMIL